jgi:hypothetical protein
MVKKRPCPPGAFYGQAIPLAGAFWDQEEATMPASGSSHDKSSPVGCAPRTVASMVVRGATQAREVL